MKKKQLSLIDDAPNLFDYAALSRDVEVEARSAAAEIKTLMRRTADDIICVGALLNSMKDRLGHGNFLPWIEAEFGMTARSAQNFMRVAEQYGSKSETVSHLAPTALYALASAEPDVRAEIERRIAAGEIFTVSDVRQMRLKDRDAATANEELRRENRRLQDERRDILANAHQRASEDADRRYQATIEDYERRLKLAEQTSAASQDQANVVRFAPRSTSEPQTEVDEIDAVDLIDARNRAHAICGALSTIDFVAITPKEFWAEFGSGGLRTSTLKWVDVAIEKLSAIRRSI